MDDHADPIRNIRCRLLLDKRPLFFFYNRNFIHPFVHFIECNLVSLFVVRDQVFPKCNFRYLFGILGHGLILLGVQGSNRLDFIGNLLDHLFIIPVIPFDDFNARMCFFIIGFYP